jgi:mRNA-degrading endonuclease RelE of RelBE toxin-antitoxin system
VNTLKWSHLAQKQLRKIDVQFRGTVLAATRALVHMPNVPNVRPLVNHQYGYRLRVGKFRVLFNWDRVIHIVAIQEVKKRDEQTY